MTFTLNPFGCQPVICNQFITYSYSCTGPSPSVDWCQDLGVASASYWVSDTLYFQTMDVHAWPPGTYTGTIIGTLGDKVATSTITMTLESPCGDAILTINPNANFVDATYLLRAADIVMEYDASISPIVVHDKGLVDCGTYTVEFFMNGGNIDTSLFIIDASVDPKKFTLASTPTLSHVGVYDITYVVTLDSWPVSVDSETI